MRCLPWNSSVSSRNATIYRFFPSAIRSPSDTPWKPVASTPRVLDPTLSQRLTSKGFSQLVDLAKTNATFPGLGVGVTRAYLEQHATTIERLVAALTEGLVFVQQPANKSVALKILMKHLRISDPSVAENGYQDHLLTLNRKPYPSLDGLRNAQRLMAQQNPKVATLKVEDLLDARFVRKLDESGFIDRLYAAPR